MLLLCTQPSQEPASVVARREKLKMGKLQNASWQLRATWSFSAAVLANSLSNASDSDCSAATPLKLRLAICSVLGGVVGAQCLQSRWTAPPMCCRNSCHQLNGRRCKESVNVAYKRGAPLMTYHRPLTVCTMRCSLPCASGKGWWSRSIHRSYSLLARPPPTTPQLWCSGATAVGGTCACFST